MNTVGMISFKAEPALIRELDLVAGFYSESRSNLLRRAVVEYLTRELTNLTKELAKFEAIEEQLPKS